LLVQPVVQVEAVAVQILLAPDMLEIHLLLHPVKAMLVAMAHLTELLVLLAVVVVLQP
jgi:hypothetical protein